MNIQEMLSLHGVGLDGVKSINGKKGEVTLAHTDVGAAPASHNHSFSGLTGVSLTTPAINNVIQFDGTNWINRTLATAGIATAVHTHAIADVTNLQTSLDTKANSSITVGTGTGLLGGGNLTANRTLTLDLTYTDGRYAAASHAHSLTDLTDVTITTPAVGHILRHNGTNWVNSIPVLSDNSDITLTTPASGHVIQHDGTRWVNRTLATAGIAASALTITAGTGLLGGGNLTANRTVSLDVTYTDGRYIPQSEKGASYGVATLDASSKIPDSSLNLAHRKILIATTTVSTDIPQLDISIPSGYDDIEIETEFLVAHTSRMNVWTRINDIATAVYSENSYSVNNGSNFNVYNQSTVGNSAWTVLASPAQPSTFSAANTNKAVSKIHGYRTTKYKYYEGKSTHVDLSSTTSTHSTSHNHGVINYTEPITKVSFIPELAGYNLTVGSRVKIYGIKHT